MFISQFRHLSSPRCTLQESFLDQERFIYFFQCSRIFPQCRSNGSQSHRPTFELVYNGTEQLVINLIQAIPVYIQRLQREASDRLIDISVPLHLSEITHTAQYGRFPSPVQSHVPAVTKHSQYGAFHGCVKQFLRLHLHRRVHLKYQPNAE